jgi:hypothetical protein
MRYEMKRRSKKTMNIRGVMRRTKKMRADIKLEKSPLMIGGSSEGLKVRLFTSKPKHYR